MRMIAAPLKIAIVGKSPHSFHAAPWNDPSWQLWWIGGGAWQAARWDCCLEIHDLDDGFKRWSQEYTDWLGQHHGQGVIYTQKIDDRIPSASEFPKDAVIAACGTSYFNNSVSWAIGYGIFANASHIALYGVDMEVRKEDGDGEYEYQRPSCEHLLGIAKGKGIDVFVHPNSSLLKCDHLYGFDLQACARLRVLEERKAELRQRIAKADDVKRQALEAKHRLQGALEQLEIQKQWL